MLMICFFSAYEHGGMSLGEADGGVEEGDDEKGHGDGLIPVVADAAIDGEQVFQCKVDDGDERIEESDDDQRADGEIGDAFQSDAIQ